MVGRVITALAVAAATALTASPQAPAADVAPSCAEVNAGALDGVYHDGVIRDFSGFDPGDTIVVATSAVEPDDFVRTYVFGYQTVGLGYFGFFVVGTSRSVTVSEGLVRVEWSGSNVRWDLSCIPTPVTDSDGDGVLDDEDVCPATELPDTFSQAQKLHRLGADSAGVLRYGDGSASGYTLADTGGCSATQIIERVGLGEGQTKFGLSRSALLGWVEGLHP